MLHRYKSENGIESHVGMNISTSPHSENFNRVMIVDV